MSAFDPLRTSSPRHHSNPWNVGPDMILILCRASSVIAAAAVISACASVEPLGTVLIEERALIGDWKLTRVGSQRVSKGLTLSFRHNGVVTGTVKCNTLGGRYETDGLHIGFINAVVTTGGCLGWPDAADRAERTLFGSSTRAFLSADRHSLFFVGSERLTFTRTS